MLSAMSIAVVWGWFGIGGAVAMLFIALFAAGAGWISRDHWDEGSGWSQVADSTSASVLHADRRRLGAREHRQLLGRLSRQPRAG